MQNQLKEVKNRKVNKVLIANLGLLLAAVIWGGGFVITKNLLTKIGPFYSIGLSYLGATAILLIIFWNKVRQINLQSFLQGSFVGSFLFLGMIVQNFSLVYTTPAQQSFVSGTYVVIVPFLYMLVTKEKVEKKSLIGAVLATIGLSLIFFQEGVFSFNLVNILAFLCPLFFAAQIVAIGILAKKEDPIALTVIQLGFAGIFSLIIALTKEPLSMSIISDSLFELGYLIILSSIIASLIYNVSLKFTLSTHAAVLLSIQPVLATLFSWFFWGEEITIRFIIGAAILLGGILITKLKQTSQTIS